MKNYIDLTLIPDLETPLYYLWEKVFPQIHLALVENKLGENTSAVGVAFPEYDADEFLLGTSLRLFAKDAQELERLQLERWLNLLSDYMQIGAIASVPEQVDGYACFNSVKPKGSREKLARRRVKRTGETLQQALAYFENYEEERSRLPFIHMQSESNGHRFRLFVDRKIVKQEQVGMFNCYGLSSRNPDNQATVPWF